MFYFNSYFQHGVAPAIWNDRIQRLYNARLLEIVRQAKATDYTKIRLLGINIGNNLQVRLFIKKIITNYEKYGILTSKTFNPTTNEWE